MEFRIDGNTAYAATGNTSPDPSRPTVVFVHGTGLDHTVWTLPVRYFARHGFNVLAVDLPGHGRSGGSAMDTIGAMSDWVVAVVHAAGLESAAFVGHSMGALVALETAMRHPDAARAVALIGISVPMAVAEELLGSAERDEHVAVDMLNLWGMSKQAQMGGNPTPGIWMLGSGERLFEKAGPRVIHAGLDACNTYTADASAVAGIDCPALLILGDRDIMAPPRKAHWIAEAIPGAQLLTVKGAGHALLVERPDDVLDALTGIV